MSHSIEAKFNQHLRDRTKEANVPPSLSLQPNALICPLCKTKGNPRTFPDSPAFHAHLDAGHIDDIETLRQNPAFDILTWREQLTSRARASMYVTNATRTLLLSRLTKCLADKQDHVNTIPRPIALAGLDLIGSALIVIEVILRNEGVPTTAKTSNQATTHLVGTVTQGGLIVIMEVQSNESHRIRPRRHRPSRRTSTKKETWSQERYSILRMRPLPVK
jgi:hypothetical protein